MATTNTWLQTKTSTKLALVLVFDGADLVYTTTDDTSGISTAWTGTDWTNFRSGLYLTGDTRQEISLFDPKVNLNSMTFVIQDEIDGTGNDFASMVIHNDGNGAQTRLTAFRGAGNEAGSISAKDTTSFASTGVVYIGHEAITYGAKTATTFGTLTRGKYNLHTAQDGTKWMPAHSPDDSVDSVALAPTISAKPTVWYNRRVRLYATHYEDGAWATKANAKILWEGRIKEYSDNGDGTYDVRCVSIIEELFSSVFRDRFTASVQPGSYMTQLHTDIRIHFASDAALTQVTDDSATVWSVGERLTYNDIVNDINEQFDTWKRDSTIHSTQIWSCGIRETSGGPRVFFRIEHSSGSAFTLNYHYPSIMMSPSILGILGFDDYGPPNVTFLAGGKMLSILHGVAQVEDSVFEFVAPSPPRFISTPILLDWDPTTANRLAIEEQEGVWRNQVNIHPDYDYDGVEGFVGIGKSVAAVGYLGLGTGLDLYTWVRRVQDDIDSEDINTPVDQSPEKVSVRQVWMERGRASEVLLRFILSTGNTDYNHDTYDKLPSSRVGLGIPASMVDIASFQALDQEIEVYADNPLPFIDVLESALAARGRHIILKDGKITVTSAGFEVALAPGIVNLSEDDKAEPGDRAVVNYATSGIINRITLENEAIEPFRKADPEKVTVQALSSITTYGQQKSMVVKTTGLVNTAEFVDYVASPAISYFSRPVMTIRRTINYNKSHLVPGDIVTLNDDNIIDPHGGSRGVSNLAAWVKATTFDWGEGKGEVELSLLPDHPVSKFALWAPSAQVDDTATNGGLDTSTLKTFTLYARKFAHSTDDKDVEGFAAGDKVRICELSPNTSPTSLSWTRTLDTVNTGSNTATVTVAIGSPAWDANKKYILMYDDKGLVGSSQQTAAFLADDDDTTGLATDDADTWAGSYRGDTVGITSNTGVSEIFETGTQQFCKPDSSYYAQAEPMSRWMAYMTWRNIHNLNNYKTRQIYASEIFSMHNAAIAVTSTSYTVVWGPTAIPLNGIARGLSFPGKDLKRKLIAKAYVKGSSASTTYVRLTTTSIRPVGTGISSTTANYLNRTYEATTTSTSYTWVDITGIDPVLNLNPADTFTWVYVEVKNEATGTSTIDGLFLQEGVLT